MRPLLSLLCLMIGCSWLAGCSSEPEAPVDLAPPKVPTKKGIKPIIEEPPASGSINRPPKIKDVLFRPEHPVKGDNIECRVLGEDPDGDTVDIDLVWVVNGSRWLDQTERTLSGELLKRGDVVQLEVTVTDGTDTVTETSKKLTVGNTAPTLLTTADEFANINGLQIRATDVDDDTLSFGLQGAPDGMSINERGVITYEGSENEKGGTYKVTLVVSDGHTGTASLSFGMTVSAGQTEQRVKRGSEAATGG